MSLGEKIKALLEALKIGVWPAVFVWAIWYLRDEVKRAAARLTELGPSGAKFAPPPEQVPAPPPGIGSALPGGPPSGPTQQASPPSGNLPSSQQGSPAQQFIAGAKAYISEEQLNPGVQAIRADLPARLGNDPREQVEALIYAVVSLDVQLSHERNYNLIFGSQLQLLGRMNVDQGVPPDVPRDIYETAKANNPDVYRAFTFEHWIGFLLGAGLCTVVPSGNYVLTVFGRGLLKYILDRRLPVNKAF